MGELEKYQELVGQLFDGRYRMEKLLGTGGMAVVYRATDTKTEKTVAIKMLKDSIAADAEAQNRFLNEAKTVSMLTHPNIVGLYEACLDRPDKYLVMEYIEGISLNTYMERRKVLSFEETVHYAEQILAALAYVHSLGIVHRDIKPQNILLMKNGIVKVTDFGIARTPDSDTAVADENAIGTVYYISPEQAEGGISDHRSDLYSLGVLMYEMVTGQLPFYDENAGDVLYMQMQQKPEPPRSIRKDIPRGLQDLILCAMEKHPDKRYQSAVDMFRELRKLEKRKRAAVLTPAQIKKEKRSAKNREKNPPSRSFTPVVLGIAVALLIVGIVSAFTALDRLKIGNLASVSITVPDAVGKTYVSEADSGSAEAYHNMLNSLGLGNGYLVKVEYEYSDIVEIGKIISQNPIAGASRKTPCDITLTVSLGPENVLLDNYARAEWRDARIKLLSLGFRVVEKYEDNPIIQGGCVICTIPAAGSVVQKGSTVELHISSTTAGGTVKVPNFVGFSEKSAVSMLNDAKLELGTVTYTRSTEEVGKILTQSVKAGETVFGGTAIQFVVSGGKDFDFRYYPDVTDMSENEAKVLLERLGCTVSVVPAKSSLPEGTVLRQMPLPGTQGNDTKEVWLTVSSGDYSVTLRLFDVTGNSYIVAKSLLDTAFPKVVVNVEKQYVADAAPVDTVLAQSIADGESVVVTDGILHITLTLSGGPDYVPETTEADSSAIQTQNPPVSTSVPAVTTAPAVTTTPAVTTAPEITTAPEMTRVPEITTVPETTRTPETPAPEVSTQTPGGDEPPVPSSAIPE